MGAVTVVIRNRNFIGSEKVVTADVTFSGTYGAGGDTYTNGQFELDTISSIEPQGAAVATATSGYLVMPDLAGKKLRLVGSGSASQGALNESGTAGQSSTVVRVRAYGNNPN